MVPAATAWGWPSFLAETSQSPHPAVVRVIAAESDGASLGSGSLVAVDANHGLVVTNWHVVRDATGAITVVFPNGFRSGAIVLRTDREWDLAALAIQRPNVQPLLVSTEPPRPGEALTIAGYGPGPYRALAGRCSEYLSPGANLPAELVEVDVPARFGDSGGPIFNSKGEIAGVLFGANGTQLLGGYTMGSYCGRVRTFLAAAYGDFRRVPGDRTMLAEAAAPTPPPPTTQILATLAPLPASGPSPAGSYPSRDAGVPFQPVQRLVPVEGLSAARPAQVPHPATSAAAPAPLGAVANPGAVGFVTPPPSSSFGQLKTILAAIGAIAIAFHGLRLIGAALG
jgi:hypothetical protein